MKKLITYLKKNNFVEIIVEKDRYLFKRKDICILIDSNNFEIFTGLKVPHQSMGKIAYENNLHFIKMLEIFSIHLHAYKT